jgi:branched-chain amino acid transport system ATP-binding protein
MAGPANAIELCGVTAGYGETVVLENFDLELGPSASLSVLGRNGVGKTTLLATIMGHATLRQGRILLNGADVSAMPIHRRNALGLGYVPQEREIFPSLTVGENLAVAERPGKWTPEAVYEMFPRLRERRSSYGDRLSGGEQQMLAVGRALIGNPTVLLLDEPSEGLAPLIVEELQATFARLRNEEAIAIVMVEQKAGVALSFADRCVVMDRGRIVFDGDSASLRDDHALLNQLIGVAV